MAIPVRLLHNTNNGSGILGVIDLEATEFRVAIERAISAFALPSNDAFKMGIDPNMPRTLLNITGILEDDEVLTGETLPQAMIIIGQFYPIDAFHLEIARVMEYIMDDMEDANGTTISISVDDDYTTSATSIVVNGPLKCTTNKLQAEANTKKSSLAHFFFNGDKVYNLKGQELGTVQSVDNSTNTITFTGAISYALNYRENIVDTTPDLFLHGKGFGLVPALWCSKDASIRSLHTDYKIWPFTPIVYKFDGNTVSKYANGGSGDVSFKANTEPEWSIPGKASNQFPTINIPIGGIFANTNIVSYGDGAKALVLAIKDGIDLSTNVTAKKTTISGGQSSGAAFSTKLSSSGYRLIITQNECTFATEGVPMIPFSDPNNGSIYSGLNYLKGATSPYSGATNGVTSGWEEGTVFEHIDFRAFVGTTGPLSAGDKAQTLLGMFANSPVGSDNEFVGIQVPYESLIQSADLTPTVRNFFLTYGVLSPDEKTSRKNSWPASQTMTVPSRHLESIDESLEDIDEADLWDALQFFGEALINVISDAMVVLGSSTRKNQGGIHIIPTKLALRYDAGQRYYTYDMVLSAIGEKISI
jgi:hypothetical protein